MGKSGEGRGAKGRVAAAGVAERGVDPPHALRQPAGERGSFPCASRFLRVGSGRSRECRHWGSRRALCGKYCAPLIHSGKFHGFRPGQYLTTEATSSGASACVGRQHPELPPRSDAQCAEVTIIEGEYVTRTMALGEHDDRRVGEADAEIRVALDDRPRRTAPGSRGRGQLPRAGSPAPVPLRCGTTGSRSPLARMATAAAPCCCAALPRRRRAGAGSNQSPRTAR